MKLVVRNNSVWLESTSAPIASNLATQSGGFPQYEFSDVGFDLFVLNIANETRDNIVFSCSLNVEKTDEAVCLNQSETQFSILWTGTLQSDAIISSTDPLIGSQSIAATTSSVSFTNLDPGHGYTIHIVRDVGENEVNILKNEVLQCTTERNHCNFSGNSYIEQVTLTNSTGDQVEVDVELTNSCSACEISFASLDGGNIEGDGNVRDVSNSEGLHLSVIKDSYALFQCHVTADMLSWSSNHSCSVETETTFTATIVYGNAVQNPTAIIVSKVLNADMVEGNTLVVFTFSDLFPGSIHKFIVTHDRGDHRFQYQDEFSCQTMTMIAPYNFHQTMVFENNVTVIWKYPTEGEAETFKISIECISTAHWTCNKDSNEMTVNRTNEQSSFTKIIQGFSPSNTYSITVSAVISTNTANSDTLTIHTKPSDVIFDDNTKCETSPTTIKLTWTQPEYNHTGIKYRIMSTTSPQSNETIAAITESLFTNLDPQTSYKFNVSAVWQTAEGDSISTSCETIAIPQPSNLNTTLIDSTTVQLRWNPVDTLPETIKYKVSCNEGSDCPPNFPYEESERTVVNVTNLIPGKVYSVSVRSSIGTFLSAGVSTEIRTRPPDCNVNEELLLQSITVNIFEESVSNISIKVDNETLVVRNNSVWLESTSAPIASNLATQSGGFPQYEFSDVGFDLFVLNIANETRDNIVFSCSLNVEKTDEAVCLNQSETQFSILWTGTLQSDAIISSTDPLIGSQSIAATTSSVSFTNLDPGHGYTIHIVRDVGENEVNILKNEVLQCTTERNHCNFSGNSYIEQVTLTNSTGDQVEVDVELTNSCSACEISFASLDGGNIEGDGNVRDVSNSEGLHLSVIKDSYALFQCHVTADMLSWSSNHSCSDITETSFLAGIEFDRSCEQISIKLESNDGNGISESQNGQKAIAIFTDLDPKTSYILVSTHEQASDGILYVDSFSCLTTDVVDTENFVEVDVGTDYITVSWDYPAIGEAEFFKLLWDCKAPSNCLSIQENSSDVANSGSETITYNITRLKPAKRYELSLTAEVKGLSSVAESLTVNTRPTKIDINATTDCQSSPTTITVTWIHSESGYDGLKYKIVSNATSNLIQTITSYVFDELDPNTEYSFSISAHRESVDGEATSFVCSTSAVPEIGNLVVADKSQTMIKLTWTYVGDLPETVEFEVFCQGSENCPEGQLLQTSIHKEIQIEHLLPGEQFIFVVRALVNQHASSNATLTVRTKLNPQDLSNLEANSPDNQIQLPVFHCSQEQKVLNVSVFWTNKNGADNCEGVTDFELNQNFTVPTDSFVNTCDNVHFQLDPLNSAKGVHYGDNICLKLVLQSGEEISEAIKEVPLFPDSISNLSCPREEITTSSVQISWGKGRGSFLKYVVTPSKSDLSSQLPENFTETSFTYTDIPHGTLLEFSVRAKAANGLESQKKRLQCRAKVKNPEFSAIEVNKTRVKIDSKIDFNEAITNFSLAVYNRSTENDCSGQLGSVEFDQTFTDDITDFILPEQREMLPGGVYCVEIATTAYGYLSESNSDVQKVALCPKVPEIETDVGHSTQATVRITNYQDVIFDRIEYALSELVWNSSNSDWTSREFKAAQAFEATEVDFNDLPKGTVLTVTVTALSYANLNATNEKRFQTKPDTPTLSDIATTNTSCTFTVSASRIVTAFEEKLGGQIKVLPRDDMRKEIVSVVFTYSGLEAHTDYQYEFAAISDYDGFNSASDKLTA